jgi:transposase
MISVLKRHEIQVLSEAGRSQREVARKLSVSERSVRRVINELPVVASADMVSRRERGIGRPSTVEVYRPFVSAILADKETEDLPTLEILRLARQDGYKGGKTALYDLVRSLRKKRAKPLVRFEGLAGEFSQHDFGEVVVKYVSGDEEKIHFFASRLKYSRFAYVEIVPDQKIESLVRALTRSLGAFAGVPLVCVFDNPKTVVLHRRDDEIEWNPTFGQVALDYRFAPELCTPRKGNQKGAVENLVGWVKNSFFKVRRFVDREDLERQLGEWLREGNEIRPSRATGVPPIERLVADRERLRPLPVPPEEYPLRFPVVVGPTALVDYGGYRYAMPPRSIGVPGTLFLYPATVRIVAGKFERDHPRVPAEGTTSYSSEDRVATLAEVSGERGRLYFKRQMLLELGVEAEQFLTEVVHRRPRTWKGDVERLFDALVGHGPTAIVEAMRVATERGLFGAEWVVEAISTGDRPQTDALRSPRIDPREGGGYQNTFFVVEPVATNGSDTISLAPCSSQLGVREIGNNTASRRDGHRGERAEGRPVGAISAPGAPSSARSVSRD